MDLEVTTRTEQSGDAPVISELVLRTYAAVPYSDHREHLMIERLRMTDAYDPALSLLAEIGDAIVGHILLTKACIRDGRSPATTLALAPLSVVPERQGRGVGGQLVGAAHRQAAALGFESILVIGMPGYYRRFGYEPLSRYPITLPFDVPDANRMILQLRPGALDGVGGPVRFAEGWLDH